jgi:hypothetical protein
VDVELDVLEAEQGTVGQCVTIAMHSSTTGAPHTLITDAGAPVEVIGSGIVDVQPSIG